MGWVHSGNMPHNNPAMSHPFPKCPATQASYGRFGVWACTWSTFTETGYPVTRTDASHERFANRPKTNNPLRPNIVDGCTMSDHRGNIARHPSCTPGAFIDLPPRMHRRGGSRATPHGHRCRIHQRSGIAAITREANGLRILHVYRDAMNRVSTKTTLASWRGVPCVCVLNTKCFT